MDEILRLKDLSFRYEEEKEWALKEVSLSISSGEKIAVLGNNGAGKSTFFRCCNGILRPKEGSLYLKGEKISWKKKEILNLRQSVGLIFQEADHQLIAGTVAEEVSFGPMNLKLSEQEVRNRVEKALAAMDLLKYQEKAPHELSGGEKKRVSIADILAMRARVILFDEPTASLDPAHTALLEQTLEKLHQDGLCLLVSTHDVNFAWRWADRAVVLSKGHILRDGPICEVFADGALLREAGLHKPELFAAAELLFPGMPCAGYPRTIDAFQAMLQENLP